MRKKQNNLETYKNEMINISNKESELLESYKEEFNEYDEKINYEDENFDYKDESAPEERKEENYNQDDLTKADKEKKIINYNKIINISFILIIMVLSMIAIDVILVARYNKGPFFAIPIKEYKDGGTKEYLGFGYKVIDYNQIQGRKDKEIGTLGLKYNSEPLNIKDLDLAIEFIDNEEETYKKYYKKFVRIESTLQNIDLEKNAIKIGYKDDGGKYTLDIICNMASKKEELTNINIAEKTYVIGTIKKYEFKTKNSNGKLILDNCFASK